MMPYKRGDILMYLGTGDAEESRLGHPQLVQVLHRNTDPGYPADCWVVCAPTWTGTSKTPMINQENSQHLRPATEDECKIFDLMVLAEEIE